MGMLLNNICYYFNLNDYISYTFDLLVGNSIIVIILLYVASYTFYFCKWHRLIISANLSNVIIANIDIYFRIPITDLQLLILYHLIAAIFIIAATISHIKENNHGRKT